MKALIPCQTAREAPSHADKYPGELVLQFFRPARSPVFRRLFWLSPVDPAWMIRLLERGLELLHQCHPRLPFPAREVWGRLLQLSQIEGEGLVQYQALL